MSWPASSARSTSGSTVSSKPRMPGNASCPALSRASRLSRISALTGLCSWPEARRSPSVRGAGAVFAYVTTPRYVRSGAFAASESEVALAAAASDATGKDGRMAARIGDGLGLDADLIVAAEQAVTAALEPLSARRPDLVVAF